MTSDVGAAILEGSELTFAYGPCDVIRDVSLRIEEGQFCGLIGANGCGKSTLLRLLSGVARPRSGQVALAGDLLSELEPRERAKRIGYVPQQQSRVYPFTALEVVLTGRSPYTSRFRFETEKDREAALESLDAVGAASLADRPITALSGGEQQMVTVARALAQAPRILLLDEPAASLDLKHRARLLAALRRLREERGLTVVVVTHDLQMLDASFDRLFALKSGELVAQGSVAEVLDEARLAEIYDDPNVRARRLEGRSFVWSEA